MKIVYDSETRTFTADGVSIADMDIPMTDRYEMNARLFGIQTVIKMYKRIGDGCERFEGCSAG